MKNDKRRITAKERVLKLELRWGEYTEERTKYLIKMLGDHVRAAHKRHARKNVCFRPGQDGFLAAKSIKNGKGTAYNINFVTRTDES